MIDDEVFPQIYLPGQDPLMINNKLQPIPRLIGRILAYNICPKIGSYNQYSCDLASCAYAIIVGLEVNWAKIIFDTMVKEHSSFLPYGAFLTHVFRKFKINLVSETNIIKLFESFDRSILLRQKLLETPPQQPTFPSQSFQHPSQSSSQPRPSHFSDAYYNTLTAKVLRSKPNKLQ